MPARGPVRQWGYSQTTSRRRPAHRTKTRCALRIFWGGAPPHDRRTGLLQGEEALLADPGGDLVAGAEAELVEDVLDVRLRRARRDHERGGNLPAREPPCDQDRHLSLARRQRIDGLRKP